MAFLTADNLVYYLVEKGYITFESIVDGDYVVLDYQRRNRNFKVIRGRHPGYFVKQVLTMGPEPISTLRREASCYWLARTQPALSNLQPITPKYFGYDSVRHVLVLELLAGSETLSDHYRRRGHLPANIAAASGELLASYHSGLGDWIMRSQYQPVFARVTPWILSMHQTEAKYFPVLSRANGVLLEMVTRDPEIPRELDALRGDWRVDGLLHGDIKWENFLVQLDHTSGHAALKLVDWEMADLGDTAWDVGAFLQNFLVFWVLSLPPDSYINPAQSAALAQYRLEDMHSAIRSFWRAYSVKRQFGETEAAEFLMRSVRFGAARMIQSAFECLYFAAGMSAPAICLLQLSLNILKQPEAACGALLGL